MSWLASWIFSPDITASASTPPHEPALSTGSASRPDAETTPEAPETVSRRRVCCCGLKWYSVLALFVVVNVVLWPVLVLVAVPKIAQSSISRLPLSITTLAITNATDTSFSIAGSVAIHNTLLVPLTVVTMSPIRLTSRGATLVTMDAPSPFLLSRRMEVSIYRVASIADADGWEDFVRGFATGDLRPLKIETVATIKLFGLVPVVGIKISKTVPMTSASVQPTSSKIQKSSSIFNDIALSSYQISFKSFARLAVSAKVAMFNPTVFSLEIGDVYSTLYLGRHASSANPLGRITIFNVNFKPGRISLDADGFLYPSHAIDEAFNDFFALKSMVKTREMDVTQVITRVDSNAAWIRNSLVGMKSSMRMRIY
ncbi:hypothetical protein SeMB42_g04614 [Synchytrium endobioticum]|uniref:Late embryogenesis abundant protein LEA-2 subgroup domain-containing protein n=1 Tax=Synchytrium endobioticum TaxID=286115 RepID=A0A507CX34_9FUNG|nr:hypothetical protein SeMB42_g04614 [Synchytrium endobioticum]TPX44915.1 hypothetical protein SeLEV6574_g04205 [Synchytrium endobioticum]